MKNTLVVLAPFTVSQNIEKEKLAERCYNWKNTALKAYYDDESRIRLQVLWFYKLLNIKHFY